MATGKATTADDAKAILNRIRQLVRALRAFDKEAQSKFGIGAAQMFILHVLQHDDDLTLNELAKRTATDQSSASLAVGRLVEEGYVSREQGEGDRRQVRLSLTARGRTLVRRSPPAAQERILQSIAEMTAAQRTSLIALLDQLLSGMGGPQGAAPMLFQDEAPKKRTRSQPSRPSRR